MSNPNIIKPSIISNMYTYGRANAKYRFNSHDGSIIFDTYKSVPPTMNNRVASLAFSLYPIPNEASNKIIDGIPKYTPLCRSVGFRNPNPCWEVNVLIVSSIKSTMPIVANTSEASCLLFFDCDSNN